MPPFILIIYSIFFCFCFDIDPFSTGFLIVPNAFIYSILNDFGSLGVLLLFIDDISYCITHDITDWCLSVGDYFMYFNAFECIGYFLIPLFDILLNPIAISPYPSTSLSLFINLFLSSTLMSKKHILSTNNLHLSYILIFISPKLINNFSYIFLSFYCLFSKLYPVTIMCYNYVYYYNFFSFNIDNITFKISIFV